jgi:hypothetical protein
LKKLLKSLILKNKFKKELDMGYFNKKQNKKLCKQYPFLIPRNRWTDNISKEFDYSYTELDSMPYGWFKAFGMDMLAELKKALGVNIGAYRIIQIKEKYGTLRWYDAYGTEETQAVIDKYSKLSEVTCIECGKPATKISDGWVSPYCDEHFDPKWHVLNKIVDGKII